MTNQQKIALFGIFRSGTNFTRTVLEWNYDCQLTTDQMAWKHGFYPITVKRSVLEYPDMNTLFVTKNPFSSINSLFNYYQSNGRNIFADKEWSGFLRKRFVVYDFFQEASPQYRFANIIDFWNAMNWNYASVKRPGMTCVHVRYEDMISDTVNYAEKVANELELSPLYSDRDGFRIPTKITRNMGDQPRHNEADYLTDRAFDLQRYIDESYFDRFDDRDIEFILEHIDRDLVKHLGYDDYLNKATERLKKSS